MIYLKKFWTFVVAFLFPEPVSFVTGPIETGKVLDDGNVPAFQAGIVTLVDGSASFQCYATDRSWIGLRRLSVPSAGKLRVDRQFNGLDGNWPGGYQIDISLESTDAADDGVLSWVVITAPGMGISYPGQAVT